MKKKRIRLSFIIATMVMTFAASSARWRASGAVSAHPQNLQDGRFLDVSESATEAQETGLEGTWRVRITPDPGGPPPSQAYHTYFRDGLLIQSNLTEGGIPGQGAWTRTGNHEFTLTFEKFVPFNPVTNQSGVFVFKVKEVVRLNGDTYTGRAEGAFCDATGGGCVSVGCADTLGQRMRVEHPSCPR